jgi:outer membrane protein OmpA-like peptidoglycan-associated protein
MLRTTRLAAAATAGVLALAGLVAAAPDALAVGTITSYPVAGSYPYANGVFDAAGNFYVADESQQKIIKLAVDGTVTPAWATLPANSYAEAMAMAPDGTIYTANLGISTVSKIAPDGTVTAVWATLPPSSYPEGIVVAPSGDVFTNGNSTDKIFRIQNGTIATTYNLTPNSQPYGMAVDTAGNVYAANWGTDTVARISAGGVLDDHWANLPGGSDPQNIAVNSVGDIFVANWNGHSLSKVTSSGTLTQTWANLSASRVGGVAVDSQDNVYAPMYDTFTVAKVSADGNTVDPTWGTLPNGARSTGLAFGPGDDLYSSDGPNHTITKLEADPTVPGAPRDLSTTPGDTTADVSFTAPLRTGHSAITGYEISTNGGANWAPLTTTGTAPITATVTGLTNGSAYAVQVRAVNAQGSGPASATSSVTPAAPAPPPPPPASPPAPPAKPTAAAGVASATVSWPASGGDVTGYTVTAHPGPATCSTTSRTDTSCVVGATAGQAYTFTVVATSAAGDSAPSAPSDEVTPTAPPLPPQPPADALTTLTTTDGQLSIVHPEQPVTVVGTGFAPYSSARVMIYSTPLVLADVTTDASGDFSAPVTIPADLSAGAHTFLATGVDPDGRVHALAMPVTLSASATLPAPRRVRVTATYRRLQVSFDRVVPAAGDTVGQYQISMDGGSTWTDLVTRGRARRSASVAGLTPGHDYVVGIRAVGVVDGSPAIGIPSAGLPVTTWGTWFRDPLTSAARARLVRIPARPDRYTGPRRTTRAVYRTHDDTLAIPAGRAAGHRLVSGQAATLTGKGLFAYDSAVITRTGNRQIKGLAGALTGVRSMTCEGYTDYAGDAGHERALATRRARAVCAALRSFGVDAGAAVHGYGPARPVIIGGSATSRSANRRVVVAVDR